MLSPFASVFDAVVNHGQPIFTVGVVRGQISQRSRSAEERLHSKLTDVYSISENGIERDRSQVADGDSLKPE